MTKKEIKQQDYIDNEIIKLLRKLTPINKNLKWDIEMIAAVRDEIENLCIKRKLFTKKQFYPYIKIN